MPRVFIALSLLILLLITSCREERLYSKFYTIPGGELAYEDTLTFAFEIKDTSERYDIHMELRHTETYQWENFYIKILTIYPGDVRQEDIVSLELSDNFGEWYSDCKGDNCSFRIPLQKEAIFPSPGLYQISINQHMRVNPVEGITGIGLTILP